jgi:hypothetical protein
MKVLKMELLLRRFMGVLSALLLPVMTFAFQVQNMPACEYADTEVATNLPFLVSLDDISRVEVSLSLISTPTNAVEVSIGTDANGDGELSFDETAWACGYSCGTWFSFDAETEEVVAEEAASRSDDARIERTFVLRKKDLNPTWNLVRVVRRGEAASSERIEIVGRKPGVAIIIW